jgi:hypothetical protein
MLKKEDFLKPVPAKMETVEVKELGGSVNVRVMSAKERDAWEAEAVEANKRGTASALRNWRCRLLVRCLCDEAGTLLFSAADAEQLGELPANVVASLFTTATKVNAIGQAEVEAIEKN